MRGNIFDDVKVGIPGDGNVGIPVGVRSPFPASEKTPLLKCIPISRSNRFHRPRSLRARLLATTLLPVFLLVPDALVSGLIAPGALAQQVTLTDPDGNVSVVTGSPDVTQAVNPAEGETLLISSGASIQVGAVGTSLGSSGAFVDLRGVGGTGSTFSVINNGTVRTLLNNLPRNSFNDVSTISSSDTGGITDITNTGTIEAIVNGDGVLVSQGNAYAIFANEGLNSLTNTNTIRGVFGHADTNGDGIPEAGEDSSGSGVGVSVSNSHLARVVNSGKIEGIAVSTHNNTQAYGLIASTIGTLVNEDTGEIIAASGGIIGQGIQANSIERLDNRGNISGTSTEDGYGLNFGTLLSGQNSGSITGASEKDGTGIRADSLSNFTNSAGGVISGNADTDGSGDGESAGIRAEGAIDRLTNEASAQITGSDGKDSYGIRAGSLSDISNGGTISGEGAENAYGVYASGDVTDFINNAGGTIRGAAEGNAGSGIGVYGENFARVVNSGQISGEVVDGGTSSSTIGLQANTITFFENNAGGEINGSNAAGDVGYGINVDGALQNGENRGNIKGRSSGRGYGINAGSLSDFTILSGKVSGYGGSNGSGGGVGIHVAGRIEQLNIQQGAIIVGQGITNSIFNGPFGSGTGIVGSVIVDSTNFGNIFGQGFQDQNGIHATKDIVNFTNHGGIFGSIVIGMVTRPDSGTTNGILADGRIENFINRSGAYIQSARLAGDVNGLHASQIIRLTNESDATIFVHAGTSGTSAGIRTDTLSDSSNAGAITVYRAPDSGYGIYATADISNFTNITGGTITGTGNADGSDGTESVGIRAEGSIDRLTNEAGAHITANGGANSYGIWTGSLSDSSNGGTISGEGAENAYGVYASGDVTDFTNSAGGTIRGDLNGNAAGDSQSAGIRAEGAIDRLTNEAGAQITANGGTNSYGIQASSLANSSNAGTISAITSGNTAEAVSASTITNFINHSGGSVHAMSEGNSAIGVSAINLDGLLNHGATGSLGAGQIMASGARNSFGVFTDRSLANLTNGGTISATGSIQGFGVFGSSGIENFINLSGGFIVGSGGDDGNTEGEAAGLSVMSGDLVNFQNYGTIEGIGGAGEGYGLDVPSAIGVTNWNGGIIRATGDVEGVALDAGRELDGLTNHGHIEGSTIGVRADALTTIINSGTIIGGQYAIYEHDDAAETKLTLEAGSVIAGLIDLGGGGNTLTIGDGLSIDLTFVTGAREENGNPLVNSDLSQVIVDPGSVAVILNNGNTAANQGRTRVITFDAPRTDAQASQLNDLTGEIYSAVGSRIFRASEAASPADVQAFGAIAPDGSRKHEYLRNAVFWTQGFGSYRRENLENTETMNATLFGYVLGADFDLEVGDNVTKSGVFAGGYFGSSELESGSRNVDNEGFFFGAYTSVQRENRTLSLAVTAGTWEASQERRIVNNMSVTGFDSALADYSGWFISPELSLGTSWEFGLFPVETVVSIRHQGLFLDGYSETGTAGQFSFEDTTSHQGTLRAEVAVPLSFELADEGTIFTRFALGAEVTEQFSGEKIQGSVLGNSFSLDADNNDTAISVHAAATAQYAVNERVDIDLHMAMEHELDRGFQYSARGGVSFRF